MGFSYTFTSVKFLSARKKTSCIQPGGAREILDGVGGRGVEEVGAGGVKLFAMNLDDLDNDMTLS